MKKLKRIIGIFLLANIFPVLNGLSTIDGIWYNEGKFMKVTPFWGGYFFGVGAEIFLALIVVIVFWIITRLLND